MDKGKSHIALYRQVYSKLRRKIANEANSGDRLPSQNELAEEFGLSFLTVREALSVLAQEGVIERSRGRDTIVIDPHGGQYIAILSELDISHPRTSYHFRCVPQLLRQRLRSHGRQVRLCIGTAIPGADNSNAFIKGMSSCDELLEDLEAERVCGVVSVGETTRKFAAYLKTLGVPVVGCDASLDDRVSVDYEAIIATGMEYLLEQERRNIAFLGWQGAEQIARLAESYGIKVRPEWVRCDLHPAAPAAGWEEFREIWNAGDRRPDGLLITDDLLFDDALHGMIAAGVKVPEELCVVTHVNRGGAFWSPFPVARLEVDSEAMAEAMAKIILALIERREPPERVVEIGGELVRPEAGRAAEVKVADSRT